jgi:hypothetical protein
VNTAVADGAVRRVAAHGLLGTRLENITEPLGHAAFSTLLRRVERHRLVGLCLAAVVDGGLAVSEEQRRSIESLYVDSMCGCLLIEAALLDLAEVLSAVDVDLQVIKGPASAHLDYAFPELRTFGDLDVLVRSEDVDRAKRAVGELGYERPAPEPRAGFDRRFGKGVTFVSESAVSIDLHRTFVMGPLGLHVNLGDVWGTTERFALGDRSLQAPGPASRLMIACYNAVLGDATPRLATLRDIAQLVFSGDVETREVVEYARRWRSEVVLARAVTAAWEALDLADITSLSAWSARYEPTPEDLRTLALYRDRSAGYAGLSWASLRAIPHLRSRIAFVRALAFPEGGRLGAAQFDTAERFRRAARGLTRSGRR